MHESVVKHGDDHQQGAIQHGFANNERLAQEHLLTPPLSHLLTPSCTAPTRPSQKQRRVARRALGRGLVGMPRVQRGEAGALGALWARTRVPYYEEEAAVWLKPPRNPPNR
jgi:hypothetical protein